MERSYAPPPDILKILTAGILCLSMRTSTLGVTVLYSVTCCHFFKVRTVKAEKRLWLRARLPSVSSLVNRSEIILQIEINWI